MTFREPLSWTKRRLSRYWGEVSEPRVGKMVEDWGWGHLFELGLSLRHCDVGNGGEL